MQQNETVYTNENPNIKTKTNLKWGPVGSYLLFISNIVFKSVGTWVTLGIFLLVYFLISIIPAFFGSSVEMATTLSMYSSIVLIVFSGILGILKTLNIFIDSQKDGMEILIVSKPINRKQIIFTRFLFLFLFAIGVSLCFLILTLIAVAIVGFSNYANAGATIGLTLVVSLFSFCCFGMLACAIGLISSGKTARILPSIIISLSAIIAISGQSSLPHVASQVFDFSKNVLTNVQKMVDADIDESQKFWDSETKPDNPNPIPKPKNNPIYEWEKNWRKYITEIVVDSQPDDYGWYSHNLNFVNANFVPSGLKLLYLDNVSVKLYSGSFPIKPIDASPMGVESTENSFTLGKMMQEYLAFIKLYC